MGLCCVVLTGCSGSTGPQRSFLPGEEERETNLHERVSGAVVRVDALDLPAVALGKCATYEAEVYDTNCMEAPPAIDTALKPNLDQSGFRYYSRLISSDVRNTTSAGPAQGSVKIIDKRMKLVMEWARWRTQSINSKTLKPLVSAVDVGVAVRITFDVTLTTSDAKLAGTFGFGSLATALAAGAATIVLELRGVGDNGNLLPAMNPTTIRDVETFSKAVNSFYAAIRELSVGYEGYARATSGQSVTPTPEPALRDSSAVGLLVNVRALPSDGSAFSPSVLAYYVPNLSSDQASVNLEFTSGYTEGVKAIASRQSCGDRIQGKVLSQWFKAGILKAYAGLGRTSNCNLGPPPDQAVVEARRALPGL